MRSKSELGSLMERNGILKDCDRGEMAGSHKSLHHCRLSAREPRRVTTDVAAIVAHPVVNWRGGPNFIAAGRTNRDVSFSLSPSGGPRPRGPRTLIVPNQFLQASPRLCQHLACVKHGTTCMPDMCQRLCNDQWKFAGGPPWSAGPLPSPATGTSGSISLGRPREHFHLPTFLLRAGPAGA